MRLFKQQARFGPMKRVTKTGVPSDHFVEHDDGEQTARQQLRRVRAELQRRGRR